MTDIIQDLTLLLLVSLPINILFHKFRLPSIMGFLVAGILIGPHGLMLIEDPESVEQLAEIGVILLLFVIGLEFSLGHLLKNLWQVLGAGSLQLALTSVSAAMMAPLLGLDFRQSVVAGLLIALSSTAIVLKMITDRAEIDTLHGRICIGILLFQDLCVVPLMLIIPLLAAKGDVSWFHLTLALFKSGAAVVAMFLGSRLVVPRLLKIISRTGSREHMTLFVILIMLGTGWMADALGLTLGMGAFIAGMILSETDYNHQIILDILPIKDYFTSIFFISVGMLMDVSLFQESAPEFLLIALGLILGKTLLAGVASLIVGNPPRISLIVGLRLAQVGEFSLILSHLAYEGGLFSEIHYQGFLTLSILTLLAAPILIPGASKLSLFLFSREDVSSGQDSLKSDASLSGHVILAGFGMVGRNLTRVLKEIQIPFVVLELDSEKIKQAMTLDAKVLYGDSTQRETLIRANIQSARILVVSIPDYQAMEQVVRLARKLNPNVYILVRTRFESQVDSLNNVGADLVVPEEFETSIEIFSRVLREYRIPTNVIEQQVELVRMEGYGMFRGFSLTMDSLGKFSTFLTATLTESFQIGNDSWVAGKTTHDLDIRKRSGARLIAVVRNQEVYANPENDLVLLAGDVLILFGRHPQLNTAMRMLKEGLEKKEDENKDPV